MKYVFHPEALTEYAQAVQYYLEQNNKVAQAFIDAIEKTIYRIRETPTRYPIVDEEIRRCMTKKFPYGILYSIKPDSILILAIMHCSRKPGYWKNRI
ncbi:type II toxin-antitoxin system RelE/ParE family toxin [Crocosphaera sp.]|uniref:type II toxin-antitoxin system RelE/ParE family toxin n=1 Tax=Crocosphaera sp. TaxID=2729996 RepID=UPI003F262C41|nr:type II toxin-antitoxin system RelE/ParE family toxin [Crocosphaera sp.]